MPEEVTPHLLNVVDIAVVDRNCHVSILHAITMTGAIPVFRPSDDPGKVGRNDETFRAVCEALECPLPPVLPAPARAA